MIRTRIAPSPTGEDIHIGNLYAAYINWVFAKKHKGKFIIRIEDTDRTRLVPGAETKILSTLKDFGIDHDESIDIGGPFAPYRQSERLEIYKKYADELVGKGYAYLCTCTAERLGIVRKQMTAAKQIPKYDKHCISRQDEVKKEIAEGAKYVIRLNVPENQDVVFTDEIRGEIRINTSNIDDQVLLKSDGFPTYHMAVVIDDHLMEISHIIRAEEWISSTPKHVLLYDAFGWKAPIFAHLPILRNPDKSKLSKRKNPVWASWYLAEGYLPEAILNYLALMGWSHPEEKDLFDTDEFIRVFDLKRVSPVGPAFDIKKLEWMNGQYIMKKTDAELSKILSAFYQSKHIPADLIAQTVPLIKERIKKLSDYLPMCEFYLSAPTHYEIDLAPHKELLLSTQKMLETVGNWDVQTIGDSLVSHAKAIGVPNGVFFMAIRVALSGKKITPPLNDSMVILGKDACISRLAAAAK